MCLKYSKICAIILICTIIACTKEIEFKNDISVSIVSVSTNDNQIYLHSSVNKKSNEIEEHGHCWSNEISEPILELASYSTLGPLTDTTEFEEVINTYMKKVYVRPFVIINNHIVYGETKVADL